MSDHSTPPVSPTPVPDDQGPKMSTRKMRDFIAELDRNEQKKEQEYVAQTRPQFFGNHRVHWDGLFGFFSNLIDNILWKLYGQDVSHAQDREKHDTPKKPNDPASKKP